MNFEFSEEQLMLREQARGFLSQHCPPTRVRDVFDGEHDYDAPLWTSIAEMGWTATAIPEAYGGLGLGYYELAIIAEELGRAVAPVPFSSSVYLATEALIAFGSESQKQRWLPGLASGETIATLAHAEGAGQTTAKSLTASLSGDSLTGAKKPVADGAAANIAIVTTTAGDGSVTLCLVELDQGNVVRTPIQTLDFSRGHATLEFNNASAESLGDGTIPWPSFESLLDRAAVLMA
ncbi:MAG: acyl-CoA dehydrogenase, partial [Halieaceae bacterium]|nr:acyl-CoA dehydrogenase [Halieaceae bacterium]